MIPCPSGQDDGPQDHGLEISACRLAPAGSTITRGTVAHLRDLARPVELGAVLTPDEVASRNAVGVLAARVAQAFRDAHDGVIPPASVLTLIVSPDAAVTGLAPLIVAAAGRLLTRPIFMETEGNVFSPVRICW